MLPKPTFPTGIALALVAAAGLSAMFVERVRAADRPDAEWHLIKEGGDIIMHRRNVDGSAVPMVRSLTVIDASPRCVYDVVSDYDRFTQFVPYVKRSRVLRQRNRERWVYQLVSLPGPVSDRHYVIRVTDDVSGEEGGTLRIEWDMEREESLPAAAAVVPAAMNGSWRLRPGPRQGTTEATYTVHFDPGGALPDWLASMGTARYLPKVIHAVRDRAAHCAGAAPPAAAPDWEQPRPERSTR